jgi:hypothetical protein
MVFVNLRNSADVTNNKTLFVVELAEFTQLYKNKVLFYVKTQKFYLQKNYMGYY